MYIQDSLQYLYHIRHYGHPSKFGYKDLCNLWKAEHFDPDHLMSLYYRAGARYFVAQAMHHDHFFNYGSKINRFNSVNVGPMADICKLWQKAAQKYDLPFGLTEHLGATFSWWKVNKWSDSHGPYMGVPYDGNDPEYRDFYLDNYEHASDNNPESKPWYTSNKNYHNYWLSVFKEMVDEFTPDLVYTDGSLPFGSHWHGATGNADPTDPAYGPGLEAVSYLYNSSIKRHGRNNAVYLQKDRRPEIHSIGICDIEKSQLSGIQEKPWHTDTCIGSWFYDARQVYKKPEHIIEMIIDIVSKNGAMLLNILQRPDGTLDDEALFILKELAGWFDICGEGIYGTRVYDVFGEGYSRVLIDDFKEVKTMWSEDDFRFTRKGNIVYAFAMNPSAGGVCVLKSFADKKVESVSLLGAGKLEFAQCYGVLNVKLPPELPTKYTNCLKIIVK